MGNIYRFSKNIDQRLIEFVTNNPDYVDISWKWVIYTSENWRKFEIRDWDIKLSWKKREMVADKLSAHVTDIVEWKNDSFLLTCKDVKIERKRVLDYVIFILNIHYILSENDIKRLNELKCKAFLKDEEKKELYDIISRKRLSNIEQKEDYLLKRNKDKQIEDDVELF